MTKPQATQPQASTLLLLPRLRVQNANAVSGPLSWGFPSPTAFTGFAHALERRLGDMLDKGFTGIGIVCHRFDPQVNQTGPYGPLSFKLSRNPIYAGWKKFEDKASAIVEEGRAHMEVSLLIGIADYLNQEKQEDLAAQVHEAIQGMRLAGGSILPLHREPRCLTLASNLEDRHQQFRKLRRQLLPGFALVERSDLLAQELARLRQANPEATALDALLDLASLQFEPGQSDPEQEGKTPWHIRAKPGWLVPLPVGYGALAPLHPAGTVAHARDAELPFCFVESLYSLGQWVSPHRLEALTQMLWHPQADTEAGIYRCSNSYSPTSSAPAASCKE